jgi:hypothetical protein
MSDLSRRYSSLDPISKVLVYGLLGHAVSAWVMAFYALFHQEWLSAFMFFIMPLMSIFVASLHIYAMTEPKER